MTKSVERYVWLSRYVPLILWIGVIFFLSSSQGSMSETSRIIRPLLEWLFPTVPEVTLTLYHAYIRKFAHFAEYFVLGFLACRAFARSSADLLSQNYYLFAVVLVLTIACVDEFNQSFDPARTSSPYDVLIDVSGGSAATAIYFLAMRSRRKIAY